MWENEEQKCDKYEAASLPGERENMLSSLCVYLSAAWVKTKTKLRGYSMLHSSHSIHLLPHAHLLPQDGEKKQAAKAMVWDIDKDF